MADGRSRPFTASCLDCDTLVAAIGPSPDLFSMVRSAHDGHDLKITEPDPAGSYDSVTQQSPKEATMDNDPAGAGPEDPGAAAADSGDGGEPGGSTASGLADGETTLGGPADERHAADHYEGGQADLKEQADALTQESAERAQESGETAGEREAASHGTLDNDEVERREFHEQQARQEAERAVGADPGTAVERTPEEG